MALLLWAKLTASNIERALAARSEPTAPPAALAFRVVAEQFRYVQEGTSRDVVEGLLGPPTQRHASGPEVEEFEQRWWNGGRNIFPADREWNLWADPTESDRWVAVVYIRWPKNEQMVYGKLKKGF
jgi:hypothetical protein